MTNVRSHMSMSLDGFVAGPNPGQDNPLGTNGLKTIAQANLEDPDYTYPQGLFDYELSCSKNGQSAEVTMYLDTINHKHWTWRKFNRFGNVYACG